MKFLLFFISFVFSIIFFIFHNFSRGKDVLGNNISNYVNIFSFSGNLLIESFIFLLIGIFFLYLFSDLKEKGLNKFLTYKTEILYFLYYIIFVFYIYFYSFKIDEILIVIGISFILSDLIFNHISNISYLSRYKLDLKYLGLIINYFVNIGSIYYIYSTGLHFIPFIILLFSIYFNILIHKNYTNYISLFFSLLIVLFLFYSLFFSLFELYIYYI